MVRKKQFRVKKGGKQGKNPLLGAALWYARVKGWPVLPLHNPTKDGKCSCGFGKCESPGKHPRTRHGVKDATVDLARIKAWWNKWPDANVGIACGGQWSPTVIDYDPRNGGAESIRKLKELMNGDFPSDTPSVLSGRHDGGGHIYLQTPDEPINGELGREFPGIDVKGKGGYVVAPPSIHADTGKPYKWSCHPQEFDLAPFPAQLLEFKKRSKSGKKKDERPGGPIREGERNDFLARFAGSLRRRGLDEDDILQRLVEENQRICDPPLRQDELRKIAGSIVRYPPADGESLLTDAGNAKRLVARYGLDLRYCPELGGWLQYDGSRWIRVKRQVIEKLAKNILKGMYYEAWDTTKQKQSKFALLSQKQSNVRAMVESAQSEPGILIDTGEFDRDPYLLNVINGTLDLRKGKLRKHRRKNLITKLVPVEYSPEATCSTWTTFLDRIMGRSQPLIDFLQRALGYSLTGDTSEQCWFLLHGTGANGKSTLINTVLAILADYGTQTASDTFLVHRNHTPRSDLARLRGARFVAASEPDGSRKLDSSVIKSFTGGDPITCRHLYKEAFSFKPEGKVFLSANHKPGVDDNSVGFWRRIRPIPFNVTIPENEQDKALLEKLRAEAPGILRWMVEGCLRWQNDGLNSPAEVREATSDYREEMDVVSDFLKDDPTIVVGDKKKISVKKLYEMYLDYCEINGEKSVGQNKFARALSGRGLLKRRLGKRREYYWIGIGLRKTLRDT